MKENQAGAAAKGCAASEWKSLSIFITLLLTTFAAMAAAPPNGLAPVLVPPGGFSIEGDLTTDLPPDTGDWVAGTNAAGAVLNNAGVPLNASTTFHFTDPFNSSGDNTFSGGLKWNDDPRTWTWTSGNASGKTDINNVLFHVAEDAEGHTWVILAADRLSTSGESYIDFELLQSPLYLTNNSAFFSAGTNGGRTVNDMVLSLAFTSGGSVPDFYAYRWLRSGSGYAYVDATASLPVGRVFIAASRTNAFVPFGAFGSTNYVANAFAEAAIDLTALLSAFDPCLSIGIKTLMVKTKTSASSSASINDFINPIQYNLRLGPSANAGPDQILCATTEVTDFSLNGQATAGSAPIESTTWSVVSGNATIDSTNLLLTTAHVLSSSATLRLTVRQANGCTEIDDVVLTAVARPTTAIAGPATVCPLSTSQYEGPAGFSRYDWSISGNGSILGANNTRTIRVAAGGCGTNFTLVLNGVTNVCSTTASLEIAVTDTQPPVLVIPQNRDLECPAQTGTNATGVATATDNCGAVTVSFADAVTPGCGGSKMIARTWTASDLCGNVSSGTQIITVHDTTAPRLTIPRDQLLECLADTTPNSTGMALAQDACGSALVSYSDIVSNVCGSAQVIRRLWTATDECGNSTNAVQTITLSDTIPPSLSRPADIVLDCPADTRPSHTGTATAQDTCGTAIVAFSDDVTENCGNTRVIRRTWTATDSCGNSTNAVQVVTVRDITPPTLVVPTNLVLECPANTATNATGIATAQDECGSTTVTYSDAVTGDCGGTRTITRTWLAIDECGNRAQAVQTIAVRDTARPSLVCPPDLVLECPADTTTNATGTAFSIDACSTAAVTFQDSVTNNCGGTRLILRRWTAIDACGNSTNAVQRITVRDTRPPALICPADRIVECPADTAPAAMGQATAVDACGSASVSFADTVVNDCGGAKVIRRMWTAVDACGNSTNALQTITVRDTTPPVVSFVPPNQMLECGADTRTNATGTALAQDACGSVSISYSDGISNSCGGTRIISRRWTATDACGNATNVVQTITVRDTTPPSLRLPNNLVLECPGDTRTNVTGVPLVSDLCGSVAVSYSDVVVSNGCGATRTVSRLWMAVDQCGNATNGTQTIAVVDRQAPRITCPTISVQCPGDIPVPYTDLAAFLAAGGTASDACSSALTFALLSDSGLVGSCPGTITRVYRLTDSCGNFADGTQRITVDDTIAPTLTLPASITVGCADLQNTNLGQVTATDNCDTNVTITYTEADMTSEYNIRWYAADPEPNHDPYQPTYLKLAPGSLPCPEEARLTGRAADPLRNAVAFGPDADSLDAMTSLNGENMAYGQIVPFFAVIDVSGGSVRPENGTIEFTSSWSTHTTSNDEFGYDKNYMVYCAFVDYADPGIIDPHRNAKVERFSSRLVNPGTIDEKIAGTFRISGLDNGDRVIVEIWAVLKATVPGNVGGSIATDLESAQKATTPPTLIATGAQATGIGTLHKMFPLPPPQPQPPLGPLPPQPPIQPGYLVRVLDRTYRATDDCGNQRTGTQRITVWDITPPALSASNLVLECPADTSTNAVGAALIDEACGTAQMSYSDVVSNACAGSSTIYRTWTATDGYNPTSIVQVITVQDLTPPALMLPANAVLEYPADTSTNAMGMAQASDSCSSAALTFSDAETPGPGVSRVILRTWTATDACGNQTNAVQRIEVADTTRPALMVPPNITLECPNDASPATTGSATATDASGQPVITHIDIVNTTCGNAKIIARTWMATDASGNTTEGVQTITVADRTPPAIFVPANRTIEAPADSGTSATGVATAQDLCGSTLITYTDVVSNTCANCAVISRVWTATDDCGNTTNATQTITVLDTTAPVISLTLPSTISAAEFVAGTGAQLLEESFAGVFASGLAIGSVPDASESPLTNSGPTLHGLLWQPTAEAVTPLQSVLAQASSTAGPLTGSATNASSLFGSGELGRQAIALTLNIHFNLAGSLGAGPNNFGSLACSGIGGSLDGSTVGEILQAANAAIAGAGLPEGYTFESLTALLGELNQAFPSDGPSAWAGQHLGEPALVVQCSGDVPPIESMTVTAIDTASNPVELMKLPDTVTHYEAPNRFIVTRSWQARDACGNVSTRSIQIQVNDTLAPSLLLDSNLVFRAGQPVVIPEPQATDNCGDVTAALINSTTNIASAATYIVRTFRATDAAGNTSFAEQSITIEHPVTPPSILTGPRSQAAGSGTDLLLTVIAEGSGPLSYQWRFNGQDIAGATGSSLALTQLQYANAGLYTVVVGNSGGSVSSPAAIVNVTPVLSSQRNGNLLTLTWAGPFILQSAAEPWGPFLDVQGAASPYTLDVTLAPRRFFRLRSPGLQMQVTYLADGSASIAVTGTPGANFILQTCVDFVNWVGLMTNTAPSTFIDENASMFPMRFYRLVPLMATPTLGSPAITAQPISQSAELGGQARLAVSVSGPGSIVYQWRRNGIDIPGATGSALTLSGLRFADAGVYTVLAGNADHTIISAPAVLDVLAGLDARRTGSNLTLTWPSPYILQSASGPSGPFQDLPGASSPYPYNTAGAAQKFFRLRSPPFQLSTTASNGLPVVDVTGAPGLNFILQGSSDFSSWANLSTNTAPSRLVDSTVAPYTMRFYRVKLAR